MRLKVNIQIDINANRAAEYNDTIHKQEFNRDFICTRGLEIKFYIREEMGPDEADSGGLIWGEHTWLMAALMYGIM